MRAFAITLACAMGACTGNSGSDASFVDAGMPVIVATTTVDYSAGLVCDVGHAAVVQDLGIPTGGDAVLGWQGSQLVVLNFSSSRDQDNATILDITRRPPQVICQVSMVAPGETGGADPRGWLAVGPTRGYATRFDQSSVAIVDTNACAVTGTIDLSPFASPAPRPFPRPITSVAGNAWIALERLQADLTSPAGPGAVVMVDPTTDRPIDADPSMPGVQAIELLHGNPVGHFAVRSNEVLIASVGRYQSITDGAVDAIDPTTHAVTTVVSETDLGGNVDAVVAIDGDHLALRVSSQADAALAIASSKLVVYTRSTHAQSVLYGASGYSLTEPVLGSDGRIYIGDRGDEAAHRAAPGLMGFDPTTGAMVAGPDACSLPPYDLAAAP